MRGPFSFAKRKKELQRAEKQKKKDERRALRKALKEAVPGSPEALRLAALLGEDVEAEGGEGAEAGAAGEGGEGEESAAGGETDEEPTGSAGAGEPGGAK